MRVRRRLLPVLILSVAAFPVLGAPAWEAEVQENYDRGLAFMREARGADPDARHAAYTEAISRFTAAKERLAKEIAADGGLAATHGALLTDINSCLYWATKFKPLSATARTAMREASGLQPAGKDEEAAKALEVADGYAARHADDPFRAAARYYDVVEGFPGTRAAEEALERCRARIASFIEGGEPSAAAVVEHAPPLAGEEITEVEGLLRRLEKACRDVSTARERRDEIARDLAELQSQARRIKTGRRATDSKRQEKEALVEREIPECREKLEKQEKRLARTQEEVEEILLRLDRYGRRAVPVIDAYVTVNDPGREMLVRLKKRDGASGSAEADRAVPSRGSLRSREPVVR